MDADIEGPEVLLPNPEELDINTEPTSKKLKTSEQTTDSESQVVANGENGIVNGDSTASHGNNIGDEQSIVDSINSVSALAVASRATAIMETLTYENCSAAFFTSSSYTNTPYCILGVQYDDEESIKEVVRARTWFTYRRNFPAIPGSSLQSDAGWGCAVRVGQMLLAECYKRILLASKTAFASDELLQRFHDLPEADFSLHKLVKSFSADDHSKIGTWLGPNNVCHSIKSIVNDATSKFTSQPDSQNTLPLLKVHVCMDSTVAVPDLPQITPNSPLLLLIPLRLGLEEINVEMYAEDIKATLSFPQTLGIIGGRPRFAYYFFGYSETNGELLALDPHTVKDFTGTSGPNSDTHICESPLYIPSIERLDPTMALGFVVRDQVELDDLIERLDKLKLCAVMKSLPNMDFGSDLDCDMPDTDDEFEILCPTRDPE